MTLVVVVAAIAVIAAGGLNRAEPVPAELGPGDEARTSTYAVTVLDAEFTDAVESEFLEADPGEKLLVVTLRLVNLSDQPIGVGTDPDRVTSNLAGTARPLLRIEGIDTSVGATIWRADDSRGSVVLQPDVPSEVAIAWPVPEDAFADGAVVLDVHDAVVRRGAIILSTRVVTWRPGELAARIRVPVEEAS